MTQEYQQNTERLGAPECDSSRNSTRTPLSQTIDTWSFGCVLSSVATWVVLGSQAYENYSERRKIAIKALRDGRAKDEGEFVPSCDDSFHDGAKVLSAVTQWHDYLRNSARRADTTTHRVLDLVDNYMLLPSPDKRLMMGELCKRLEEITTLSAQEYQHNLDMALLRQIGPETLNALQELDNQAPAKAVTAYAAGAEMSISGGGLSPAEAADDKTERSTRVRKSERFDKIVLAKTANRVQNSPSIPGILESPVQPPESTELTLDSPVPRDSRQQENIPAIRLHSSDSPVTDDVGLPE